MSLDRLQRWHVVLNIAVLQMGLKFKQAIFGGLPLSVYAVLNNYSTLSNILA
jgi:hypothetical protein